MSTKTFYVKKFTTGQEIYRITFTDKMSITCQVTTQAPRFVVMKNGKPYFSTNPIDGTKKLESYPRKAAAQQSADYFNR